MNGAYPGTVGKRNSCVRHTRRGLEYVRLGVWQNGPSEVDQN